LCFVAGRGPHLREEPQKCIDRFLEVRNQISHLRRPGPEELHRLAHELDALLKPLAESLEPLWSYRLRACQQVGGSQRWRELVGPASLLNWGVCSGEMAAKVTDGEVFLWHPDRSTGLRLSPLWWVRWPAASEARGQLLLFSKRAHKQGVYVDVDTRTLHKLPGMRVTLGRPDAAAEK
jgi:hypothetical protein